MGWGIFETKFFLQKAKVLLGIHITTWKYNVCSMYLETKVFKVFH